MTNKDRAALHKEILDKLEKRPIQELSSMLFYENKPLFEMLHHENTLNEGFNLAMSLIRKAIDEVFSSKKTL